MEEVYTDSIIDLLQQAHSYGLAVTLYNEKLLVQGLKGKNIDHFFLDKIRANKGEILAYLQNIKEDDVTSQLSKRTDYIELQGRLYYKINPSHPSYWWLDENRDVEFKKSLFKISAYNITSKFDVDACRKAVRHLIDRHEVLRTTFHQIDDILYMRVEEADDTRFDLQYKDLRRLTENKEQITDDLLNFSDNEFDLFVGPLFLVRLLHIDDNDYILSMTIHHSIYDGWSIEVLNKDFMAAYAAINNEAKPALLPLHLQYKDYMYLNSCYQQQNFESHKRFWLNELVSFPNEIVLPGEKRPSINCQECEIENAVIALAIKNRLNNLSKRCHASIFNILQAAFSSFIKELTGENEIIWGTIGFNRDSGIDIEQQIGAYAKFYLLRTVLSNHDSFTDILEKIKKANDDALHYRAYSLLDALHDTLPPGRALNGCAWKFSLFYEEKIGYGLSATDVNPIRAELSMNSIPVRLKKQLLNISIELKFINHDDKIDLIVAYQKDVYDAPVIKRFINGFIQHLKIIAYSY